MSTDLKPQIADAKSAIQEAAATAASPGQILQVLEHSAAQLVKSLDHLHPDIPGIEAEVKPAVAELVDFAFGLIPQLSWAEFLKPQVEGFVNHLVDVGLRKVFPAAA